MYKLVCRFNVYFLFGFKYVYFYKYKILFPVLIPRDNSIFYIKIIKNFVNAFFLSFFFEAGFGSGFCTYILINKNFINFFCVDSMFVFLYIFFKNFKNKIIKEFYIYNCNWFYVFLSFKKFNLIFINPPYLSMHDSLFFNFNVISEHKYSLVSKFDGFLDIYFLIKNAYDSLFYNGFLFLEHGFAQANKVRSAMALAGFVNIFTYNDFDNSNRFTVGEK